MANSRHVLDAFTRAYLHAAAFTEDPDPAGGEYSEPDLSEFDPAFVVQAIADCAAFQTRAGDWITEENIARGPADDTADEHAGRDFWYTRNGHGCGFWDGDWTDPAGRELEAIAKAFGAVDDPVLRSQTTCWDCGADLQTVRREGDEIACPECGEAQS